MARSDLVAALDNNPVMCPHRGQTEVRKESLPVVESLGWGAGRGADKESGAERVGREESVEPARTGMNPAGCLLDSPEVPGPPNLSRWVGR